MNALSTDWRNRLRGDPAAWLLDYSDNPSIYFWFQRDVVGRPEDSPALIQARALILYSAPVQQILAAQDEGGFWDNPDSLTEPRGRATLWPLALLAELGAPRASRRARTACEFIVQNHFAANGKFVGLDDQAWAGLLLRTLLYFNYHDDPRVARAIDALVRSVPASPPGAAMYAVWALAEMPDSHRSPVVLGAITQGTEIILNALARNALPTLGVFPPFDDNDALLALRVLSLVDRANDPRTNRVIEKIWKRQGEGARWQLEKSYNGQIAVQLEDVGVPSKWATLNVLRVVTKA
jgi:hypothetical protein